MGDRYTITHEPDTPKEWWPGPRALVFLAVGVAVGCHFVGSGSGSDSGVVAPPAPASSTPAPHTSTPTR
ncbi:hypothetical protein ACFV4P_02860 [Kitasatospora sp. NPDC059795]|uniref:hypothetical protein n=1 Tax=Kitasatospora sp. NPDC059795 TaxID=3346949 RepID=UPI0036670DDC